jgi:hypothetical protein
VTHVECVGEALATSFGVHTGAMHPGLRLAHEAVFVERQSTKPGECLREDERLIETTLAFTRGMERDWNHQVSLNQRGASLRFIHLFDYSPSDMWPQLHLQD